MLRTAVLALVVLTKAQLSPTKGPAPRSLLEYMEAPNATNAPPAPPLYDPCVDFPDAFPFGVQFGYTGVISHS